MKLGKVAKMVQRQEKQHAGATSKRDQFWVYNISSPSLKLFFNEAAYVLKSEFQLVKENGFQISAAGIYDLNTETRCRVREHQLEMNVSSDYQFNCAHWPDLTGLRFKETFIDSADLFCKKTM